MLAREAGLFVVLGAHPNIVSLRRVVVAADPKQRGRERLCILVDLSGETLERLMHGGSGRKFDGPLYEGRVGGEELDARGLLEAATLQLYCGLDHMHRHGVMHQDIKPANVARGAGFPRRA